MVSVERIEINQLLKILVLPLCATLLSACSEVPKESVSQPEAEAKTSEAPAHGSDKAGIQWYDGSVEEAFAEAKAKGKPVLLYWGAEWCPPCAQLKATIFKEQDFIAKTGLFVPVYLDGDEENAQEQGEKFGVRGYPTLIVFSPSGEEMTRIPGGLELDRYAKVLDITLKDVRSVKSSFAAVLAGEAVSDDDFRLLAYYSWGQDNQRVLPEGDTNEAFYAMYEACPPALAEVKTRLYLNYLSMKTGSLEEGEALSLDEQNAVLLKLNQLMADVDLRNSQLDFLFYGVESTFAALADVDKTALQAAWTAAVQAQADNESLPLLERLGPLNVEVAFERLASDGKVSDETKARIKSRLAWADAQIHNTYERQSVVNMSWGILSDAGMVAEGEALLNDALSKSATPYYFMVDMADIAQKAGRTEEAVGWLEKAFNEAEGPATRIQWGVMYLLGLVEMQPERGAAIQAQTLAVLAEFRGAGDYRQRNTRSVERMSRSLLAWNEAGEHDAVIAALKAVRDEKCATLIDDSVALGQCQAFLEAESRDA